MEESTPGYTKSLGGAVGYRVGDSRVVSNPRGCYDEAGDRE